MNTATGCVGCVYASPSTLATKASIAHYPTVQNVPALLADNARALVKAWTADVPGSGDGDDSTRVLGPMDKPFEFLYVMLLGGPDAADRAQGFSSASGSFSMDGYFVLSNLTDEVNRPALLVERRPDAHDVRRKTSGTTSGPGSTSSRP